jgi:uncharacterized protein (TIGR02285 family)
MKSYFYFIGCVLFFIFTSHISGNEDCTIYWLHPNQPPLSISKGVGAGMGIVDCMEKNFEKHLKECKHIYINANYEKIMTMLKNRDNICSAALYRSPEREKFTEFSIPFTIAIANELIILESNLNKLKPFLNTKGAVKLEDLIKTGFRIGVVKSRVYRSIIDETLKKYKNSQNIIEHTGSQNVIDSLINMMEAGRIDAVIGYSFEAQYVVKTIGKKINIVTIPIAGHELYGLPAVGCSKTKKGKEIINRLNAFILKNRKSPVFMECTERWLDPLALQRFREYIKNEFKE